MNVGIQHQRSEYTARVTSDPDVAGPRAIGFDLRATQRPPTGEYGALSQEVLSLHNRSLGVFGATLALATVVVWRWFSAVEASNDSQAHLLALFLAAVVGTAMTVTYRLYEKAFRIAAYVEVFHESSPAGWHSRSRLIQGFLSRRKAVQHRSVANISEPRLYSSVYLALAVVGGLLMLASPMTDVGAWALVPAVVALGLCTYLFFELGFAFEGRQRWWRWWWAEYRRLEDGDGSPAPSVPTARGRVDTAYLVGAILLLELVLLFVLGLTFQPRFFQHPLGM
jgi:hypothetical protein